MLEIELCPFPSLSPSFSLRSEAEPSQNVCSSEQDNRHAGECCLAGRCSSCHSQPDRNRSRLSLSCIPMTTDVLLKSVETSTAIFNVTAPALDLSYIAVIGLRRYYGSQITFRPGPFHLGRWSLPLNIIAIIWVLFISAVLFFPNIRPVCGLSLYMTLLTVPVCSDYGYKFQLCIVCRCSTFHLCFELVACWR